MADQEMIDRVAIALCIAGLECLTYKDEYAQDMAIAVIKAMRKPTEDDAYGRNGIT